MLEVLFITVLSLLNPWISSIFAGLLLEEVDEGKRGCNDVLG
jgi:hypothetical protein